MKKRLFVLGLVIAMTMSTVVGCGKSSSSKENTANTETTSETSSTPSSAAAGSVTGDKVKISLFAGSIPENTPTGKALAEMADYINKNSNGTIEAQAFYDTALGDATSMVQGLQQGTIDIGVAGTSYFSGLVPEVDVFQLPFLFSTLEEARAAVDGEAKDVIFKKLSDNSIVGLSFWENGFRELTNNVRPVKVPDDLKGIKMRTLPAEVQVATWKAMGALPTTIDAAELYTALQQGTVSAQDNPLHEIVSRKFYEVQKYVTLTDAVYTPFLMAMSQKTWNKLSESQQKLITDAAAYGQSEQRKFTDEAQQSAKQTLLDAGCQIEENPDKDAFKEKAMPSWSIFTDKYGTELVDMIQGK